MPASFELTRQHCHQRIVTQFVVVVQAKRNPEHPLTDQCHHLVLNEFRAPHVVKARRKPTHHPDGEICRAQKQRPGIRGDRASVKGRNHLPSLHGGKSKQFRVTLCRHRGAPQIIENSLQHNGSR